MKYFPSILFTLFTLLLLTPSAFAAEKPNILFIAVDDLNHWVAYTGRNEQVKTPNITRLCEKGVAFTNAHCAVPACGPSRAALFSGLRASTTGCYHNADPWKQYIPEGISLNAYFKKNGYYVAGMGKTYHASAAKGIASVYASEWNEYPPISKGTQTGGAEKYQGYFTPLPLDMKDEDICDWHTVNYCIEQLDKKREKPFFLACGFVKPHLPWAVPRKYYEMFPRDEIKLPPHIKNDLDDIPPMGLKLAKRSGDHAKMLKLNRWKAAIQSYLATCAYMDAQLGRLLDALEKSKHADNTVIVFWGDHGWSLGEKEHWRKFALWEEATRAPLIWVAPGVAKADTKCDAPVDFMTIYPTLCELAGLPIPKHVEGESVVPLLKDPKAKWDGFALTTYGYKNHSVRTDRWRYIRYADDSEELYDHSKDPYEWKNLAKAPEFDKVKKELGAKLPEKNMPPKKGTSKNNKKKKH